MLAKLKLNSPSDARHCLVVFPKSEKEIPEKEALLSILGRKKMRIGELLGKSVSGNAENGTLYSWLMLDFGKGKFERQTQIREAIEPLLQERPNQLGIIVLGDNAQKKDSAEMALYCAWVNGALLPSRKKKKNKPLSKIHLSGVESDFSPISSLAKGNLLARELTSLPPNELTPANYRSRIRALALERHWKIEEYDFKLLKKMGAGAFCAVAQGSCDDEAAIVHLKYEAASAKKRVALVGKGICFDTGGHNLKPAKYMQGMHEDMNGSAVALGLLLAASEMGLDVNLDCFLAIAQNHISPAAYKQNDIVTALNGTTIEITHTDAEGRMVLADALTMASRQRPDLIIDFATLTGSMATALGARYSGILGNDDSLLDMAVRAGKKSGERLCAFPMDSDYEKALESDFADIKQCTMEGEADHILAALFLQHFVDKSPWLHIDLSASNCKGGLGAVSHDITGFGVGWGMDFLGKWKDVLK